MAVGIEKIKEIVEKQIDLAIEKFRVSDEHIYRVHIGEAHFSGQRLNQNVRDTFIGYCVNQKIPVKFSFMLRKFTLHIDLREVSLNARQHMTYHQYIDSDKEF